MAEKLYSKGDRVTITVNDESEDYVVDQDFYDGGRSLSITPVFKPLDHDAWGWASWDEEFSGIIFGNPYPYYKQGDRVFGRYLLESKEGGVPCFQPASETGKWVVDAERITAFEEVVLIPADKFAKHASGNFKLVNAQVRAKEIDLRDF